MRALPGIATMVCAVVLSADAGAGPLVLEETARLLPPEAGFQFSHGEVAIDGNSAIVVGSRAQPEPNDFLFDLAAYLFERDAAGNWRFVRKLTERSQTVDTPRFDMTVAMNQGVAAVTSDRLHVFERTAAGWVEAPASGNPNTTDMEIDAGTILASSGTCSWDAEPFRKASNGSWTAFGRITGGQYGCLANARGGDVDISGNRAIVMNNVQGAITTADARIYQVGAAPPWAHVATLTSPDGAGVQFGPSVALRGDTALVSGPHAGPNGAYGPGTYVFNRDAGGVWNAAPRIEWPTAMLTTTYSIELRDNFVLQAQTNPDSFPGVDVHQRQSDGTFRYVARLTARTATQQLFHQESLGDSVAVSGRTVIVNGSDAAYIYNLPTSFAQPAVQQEDFQLGNASRWTPLAGSSFAVAGSGVRRVYRQSSVAGNAASLLADTNWQNQSIEADIRPTAFSGADRWVGLVVRYQDAGNYYYLTLRSSNVLDLRRIVNGTFVTLTSVTLPVTLNKNYRLRLQAVGTYLKVYLDGSVVPQLQISDDSLRQGQAGVMMYRARADYDNVVVSPNPVQRVMQSDFAQLDTYPWVTPTGQWSIVREGQPTSTFVLRQSDLSGGGRATTGVPIDDQVVMARARPIGYSGSDRWFGLIARYRDAGNYYYVTLRNSNNISLRKLVNGVIHNIASAPMSVTGATYALRFEAIGSSLRVYVNGELVLQGTDASHSVGTYGMATYKASVSFDDFLAFQP